jgi:hypothetical protein
MRIILTTLTASMLAVKNESVAQAIASRRQLDSEDLIMLDESNTQTQGAHMNA